MLDIKIIRENPVSIQKVCDDRGLDVDISMLLAIDAQRSKLLAETEELRSQSNKVSQSINGASPEERAGLIQEGSRLKKEVKVITNVFNSVNDQFNSLMMNVPNLLAEDTPMGKEEADNVELEVFGKEPQYDFPGKNHIDLGAGLGMDFEAATRVAGSGFPLLRGELALLENAVLKYVYDRAIYAGFTPVNVPLLAKSQILQGLGFNPRRDEEGSEVFSTIQDDLCLAGTAEISLVGQYAGQIIDESALPIKLVAQTPCFRREGAYGRRDAGLYRNKMFNKVELVVICTQEQSHAILEEIREFELVSFEELDVYHRIVRICAGDLGAPAFMKYDIEGWMTGRADGGESSGWGELTSCSNCTDYQARRLNIRSKAAGEKPRFAHTLNGTGVTTRALIPILEQYQNEDGSVRVPEVLQPYLGGKQVLGV